MARPLVFFYGTLWTGECTRRARAVMADGLEPVGPASLRGRLYDLGAYPGLLRSPRAADRVRGYLYRLLDTGRSLRWLDWYEDYLRGAPARSVFLRRRAVARRQVDGRTVPCWVYFYNRPVLAAWRIIDGDYSRLPQ